MNVMLIVTQCFCFVFFPEELNIQYNHNSLNLGLAINSHPLYGIKSIVRWLVRWELITTTAPTCLHWRECWSTTGPNHFWCFTYPCECFNICLCDVWYGMHFCSGEQKHTTFFVFLKSGVSYLFFTVQQYFCWLESCIFYFSVNVKSSFTQRNVICLTGTEGLESDCFQVQIWN